MSPQEPLPASTIVADRFEIEELLGEGAMGQVYLAKDGSTGARVALKLFRESSPGRESRTQRYYRREVDAMHALDHPNIIKIVDVGETTIEGRERFYFTMEYLAGQTLDQLHGARPVAPRWAIETVATLARALSVAHERQFVHRDVKPRNILIVDGMRPVLLDFGLVKLLVKPEPGRRRNSTQRIKGTWSYMAPEQFHRNHTDVRSDVYSLGSVLLWLLTGVPANPVRGGSLTATELVEALGSPPPGADVLPHLDTGLEAIWRRALAFEPAERFPSMIEFAEALEQYLELHDRATSHRLVVSAGAPARTLFLDRAAVVLGNCPESPLALPDAPEVLFRLLRPRDDFLVLAGHEAALSFGHMPSSRRTLQHGDAIDWGELRFVYRRD